MRRFPGQLAAPPAETSVQYPDEMDFIKDGEVDYDAYGEAYDAWWQGRQAKTASMLPTAVTAALDSGAVFLL